MLLNEITDLSENVELKVLMLKLLSSKAQRLFEKPFENPSKPCHVDIHCMAITEYSQTSTQYYPCARVSVMFLEFLHDFVLAKLATSSIRVNHVLLED